jgi:hypothetical protein
MKTKEEGGHRNNEERIEKDSSEIGKIGESKMKKLF